MIIEIFGIESLIPIRINHLEEVEEETDDATHPGHQGAGAHLLITIDNNNNNNNNSAHRLVPDHCREHLSCVDVDDGETGAGPKLAYQGQEDLKEHGLL